MQIQFKKVFVNEKSTGPTLIFEAGGFKIVLVKSCSYRDGHELYNYLSYLK